MVENPNIGTIKSSCKSQPTIKYADIIVKDGGKNPMAIEVINNKLLPMIESRING